MAASPSSNSERFAIVSNEERNLLLKDAVPDTTRTATAFWIRTFEEFCSSTGVSCKLGTLTKTPYLTSWNDSIVALERKTVVSTSAPATFPQEARSRDI